jgi:hypothetical protein
MTKANKNHVIPAQETVSQFINARANPKGPGFASPFAKGGFEGDFKGLHSLGELKSPLPPLQKGGNTKDTEFATQSRNPESSVLGFNCKINR